MACISTLKTGCFLWNIFIMILFGVRGVKEDTIFITMPMTYHYEELTGKLDGFSLKLEPEVDPVWFKKQ